MRFAGHAFVDWDDTIAENIRYFNQIEEANINRIARATGADPGAVRHRGQQLDVATARRLGLVKESLSVAWVDCYHEFCAQGGVPIDGLIDQEIRHDCRYPFEVSQELLPGSTETLAWLHQNGFEVTIWTAGEASVQGRKIRESGLHHLVHREQIVLDKTVDRLIAAMEERELTRCFVVGNSVHSDIRPALAAGVLAYHIPAETWAYDHGRIDLSDPNYHRVDHISDLPGILTNRFRLAV